MKDQDEIHRLNERIQSLEQELRTAKEIAFMGLTGTMWAHSIYGHAINIRDLTYSIRDAEAGEISERVDGYLTRINKVVDAILRKPITSPVSSDVVSIGDFLKDYVRMFNEGHFEPDMSLKLECSTEARVKVDPTWLRYCISIIVENAVNAMRNSPQKVLTIYSTSDADTVKIRLSDTGPGLPESLRSQIFRSSIAQGHRTGHYGFGLLIAKTIVEAFGGGIQLDEAPRVGAAFIISLPKW